MATVYQLPTQLPGSVGINPNFKFMVVGDNLATVTTAGYLNQVNLESYPLQSTDLISAFYNFNPVTQAGTYGLFGVAISNGVITLSQASFAGEVTLPTIPGHIATYTNVSGGLSEDAATAINGGNIQAGLSGTAGTLASFPATAAKGSLVLAGVANTGNTNTTISNAAMGQATVVSIPDPGVTTTNFILANSAAFQVIAGGLQVNSGGLAAGSGTLGGGSNGIESYSPTAHMGGIELVAINNTGDYITQISNTAMGQGTIVSIPDPVNVAARFLVAATATPFTSGNFPQASGTGGLMVDSGVSVASLSGAITQLGQLQQISVTLTPAQVIASYATPIVLIPAVAGKVAIVHSANVYTASTGNTAFATGVGPIIQYGTTAHGAGTIAVGTGLVTGDITAAASQVRTINAAASTVYTGNTNTAVTFSCTTAYTAGTGTNVTFTLVYELITATV